MPRRPKPSQPDLDLVARWAPWAAAATDGDVPTVTDGFFLPGDVTVSDDGRTVRLYDEIGFWGVTAGEFAGVLDDADPDEFTLRINSPGGDVWDGLAIYNTIRSHPATVNVAVDGIAASAASFIAQAGDTVTMMRGSQMMIHDALGLCIGNAATARELADLLDAQSDNIAGLYAAEAGGDSDQWRARMRAETWYMADAAVAAGLAQTVEGGDDEPSAPSNVLRMAWNAWYTAYAGRDRAQPVTPEPPRDTREPARAAFPGTPGLDVINAVQRR